MPYIRSGERFRKAAVAEEKGKPFRSSGRNCDIIFPVKWKVISTRMGRLIPVAGQFVGNFPWIAPFHLRHSDC
jgi:hypothetical protein